MLAIFFIYLQGEGFVADSLLRQWEMLKLIPRDRTITVREIKDKLDGLGYCISSRSIERDLDKLSIPF